MWKKQGFVMAAVALAFAAALLVLANPRLSEAEVRREPPIATGVG
jgi:hypothetical protein